MRTGRKKLKEFRCDECGKIKPWTEPPHLRLAEHERGNLCRCDEGKYDLYVLGLERRLEWYGRKKGELAGRKCPGCGSGYGDGLTFHRADGIFAVCPDCGRRERIARDPSPWRDQ